MAVPAGGARGGRGGGGAVRGYRGEGRGGGKDPAPGGGERLRCPTCGHSAGGTGPEAPTAFGGGRGGARRVIAVGMPVTGHPPHRSRRAQFAHRAPTSGE